MGQAKSRGSLDQRVAQSIARKHEQARQQMMGLHRAAVNLQELSDALRAADPRPVREVVDMGDGIQVVADAAYGSGFGVVA